MKYNILWIVMLLLAASCLDDKNDYNYKDVNTVDDTKITGIDDLTCFPDETVVLTPKVKFSIDSLNPDISYEWYLNGVLLEHKEASYQFVSSVIGEHVIVFCAIDNKTGIKFTRGVTITVQSRWMKGWLILSKGASDESQLSIVLANTQLVKLPNDQQKDSLIYVGQDINIMAGLGRAPKKLVENFMVCDYGFLGAVDDEIALVQDDKCAELHGLALTKTINTEDEFIDGAPANFLPVDVVMTTSLKCVLNQDGHIYTSKGAVITDFHAGRYPTEPAFGGKKFKALIPSNRNNADFFLALDETNTLYAIIDDARCKDGEDADIGMDNNSGALVKLSVEDTYDQALFSNIPYEVVFTSWIDGYYEDPSFVFILKEKNGNNCFMHTFTLDYNSRGVVVSVSGSNKRLHPISSEMMNGFVDASICCHSKYVMIASGKTLYSCASGYNTDKGKPFKTFEHNIVSINCKDMGRNMDDPEEYFGGAHVGVALDNGEFYIYEVNIDERTESVSSTRELYHHDGFGNIVDVIYKYGDVWKMSDPWSVY